MVQQRKIIYWATVVILILTIGMCFFQGEQNFAPPFSVVLNTSEGAQNIQLWESEDQIFYIFLPSYAELTQVQVDLHTDEEVCINGQRLTDGITCEKFLLNVPYDFSYKAWGSELHGKVMFLKSANVAALFIDTQSGSMDYIHEKKKNSERGKIALYFPDGRKNYSGGLKSIQGRGNNTWDAFEKKPYSLQLSEPADLLEIGSAERWILLANADDPSNLRNKIVYDFAKKIDLNYAPDSDWVDLYLNGEYAGLYLLSERNEIHQERVDISPETGVLLSLEKEARLIAQKYPYVKTNGGQSLRIHHPSFVTDAELRSIADCVQSVENAILTGSDAATGKELQELIDMDSWVKIYMVDEFFGNLDGFWISRFFYYDCVDGKLMAGPVWDYDKAIGNDHFPEWSIPDSNVLVVSRHAQRKYNTPLWANQLYAQPEFQELLITCFVEDFLPLLDQWLDPQINQYAERIDKAAALNGIRWNSYGEGTTFDMEVAEVVSYLQNHAQFLCDLWIDKKDVCQVCITGGGNYLFYTLQRGEKLQELPAVEAVLNMTFVGWYNVANDEPFDITRPITEDVEIYAKWQDTPGQQTQKVEELLPRCIFLISFCIILGVDVLRWKGDNRKNEKSPAL